MRRSRTRSARLDEPYVFFIDRCLGKRSVPELLKQALIAGERLEIHDGHFAQNERDASWLASVGARGWVEGDVTVKWADGVRLTTSIRLAARRT